MTVHQARAFAPGHLTAFFKIADRSPDQRRRGSLGAGICLSKGAYSVVGVVNGDFSEIRVRLNGEERDAGVTKFALTSMISESIIRGWVSREREFGLQVDTTLELPEKSGWGMSGAGALSAVLAFREALNLPFSLYETAYFAHLSELRYSTGLGDVAAQCTGGLTIRKKPGIPPHGFVDNIPVPPMKVVCLTLSEPLSTSSVLEDYEKRGRIDSAGEGAVDGITRLPTLDMFLEFSKSFTISTGLASPDILEALEAINGVGRGGMAMLGNSLFAIGETEELVNILKGFGRVDVCDVDFGGARVV